MKWITRTCALVLFAGCNGGLPLVGSDVEAGSADVVVDDAAQPNDAAFDSTVPDVVDATTIDATDAADASTGDANDGGSANDAGDAAPEASLVTLAEFESPVALAVDATNVYWANGSGSNNIRSCAIGGCNQTPTTVLANLQHSPFDIAIDSKNAYYPNFYTIGKCALSGCDGGTDLVSGNSALTGANAIATDGTNTYWGSSGNSTLYSCNVGGCNNVPTKLTNANVANAIIAVGSTLYFANNFEIDTCATTGCTSPTTFASGQTNRLASDGTNVYWADDSANQVFSCAVGGCNQKPTVMASNQYQAYAVATDGTNVYWTTLAGLIMKCSISNCSTPMQLQSNQSHPIAIAVDATSVYWINSQGNGEIQKLTPK
jgi:hypothetical protein